METSIVPESIPVSNDVLTPTQLPQIPQKKKSRKEEMGWFTKGGPSPNPRGRPKGSLDLRSMLLRALPGVEYKQGKPLMQHAWERAYKNDKVLISLLSYYMPSIPRDGDGSLPRETRITIIVNSDQPVTNQVNVDRMMVTV